MSGIVSLTSSLCLSSQLQRENEVSKMGRFGGENRRFGGENRRFGGENEDINGEEGRRRGWTEKGRMKDYTVSRVHSEKDLKGL